MPASSTYRQHAVADCGVAPFEGQWKTINSNQVCEGTHASTPTSVTALDGHLHGWVVSHNLCVVFMHCAHHPSEAREGAAFRSCSAW